MKSPRAWTGLAAFLSTLLACGGARPPSSHATGPATAADAETPPDADPPVDAAVALELAPDEGAAPGDDTAADAQPDATTQPEVGADAAPDVAATGSCQTVADCPPTSTICHVYGCQAQGCVLQPLPDGSPCQDGNQCTANDHCEQGKCTGTALVFDVALPGTQQDLPRAVTVLTSDEAFAYAGQRENPSGGEDLLVIRVGKTGQVDWALAVQPTWQSHALGIAAGPPGLLAVGEAADPNTGTWDGVLVAVHPKGVLQWQKVLGGPGEDRLRAVTSLGLGWVAVGERTVAGKPAAWVVRLDPDGNVLWQQDLATEGTATVARAVTAMPGGGVMLAGEASVTTGVPQAWLARLDGQGSVLWQKVWSTPEPGMFTGVASLTDGSVWIAGTRGAGVASLGRVVRLDAGLATAMDVSVFDDSPCWSATNCDSYQSGALVVDAKGWAHVVVQYNVFATGPKSGVLRVAWNGNLSMTIAPTTAIGCIGAGLVRVGQDAGGTHFARALTDGQTTCPSDATYCPEDCGDGSACTVKVCYPVCALDTAVLDGAPCGGGKTCLAGVCL
jgi:hypothetical protein